MTPNLKIALSAAALAALACTHSQAPDSLRLSSEIGAKSAGIAEEMRARPLLEDLDLSQLETPWFGERETFDAPASPALSIGTDEKLALEFRGTPLGEVLAVLGETASVNIVFDAGLVEPIDASFPSITIGEALFAVLEQNSLELIENQPGLYAVRDIDAGGGRMRSFKLSSIRAADAAAAATQIVGEEATVVTDAGQNLLFVRGSREAVEAVASYLDRADRLEQQVLIEVHILEALIDEDFELGVTHAIDGSIDSNAFSIAQDLATANAGRFSGVFNSENGDISTTINALQSYVDLEMISAPRVMTVSGAQANIEVVEEIPYIEATASSATNAGQSVTAIEEIAFKEAGVKLDVTPTIQANGILKVAISKELSEVVGQFQTIPIIDKRTLKSEFLVADRQTIVLGGLMQDRRSDQNSGVPVLKDIPLLGRLFRSDVDTTEKRELLVFVTPRVVDPNEAAVLAQRYQDHYERRRTEYGLELENDEE